MADVHLRSGVAGLRALGKAGLQPVALGRAWGDPGLWSRYAAGRTVTAGTGSDAQRLADALRRLGPSGPVVPYPGMETTIDAVLAARSAKGVLMPWPVQAVRALRRKSVLAELASGTGVAVPRTSISATVAELRRASVSFPCAVKSDGPVGALDGTRILRSDADLHHLLDQLPAHEQLVVQGRLGGPLVCLALVIDRAGEVVSRFQHVATRTWPREAGPTAYGVSVAPDDDLTVRAGRLAADAGFWGLVQMDFLHGPDGLTLIDANPRFYPALTLATACGVNLPAAWHAVTVRAPAPAVGPYRLGVRYRWLEADVLAALRGRPACLLKRPGRPTAGAMWDSQDPCPASLLAIGALMSRSAGVISSSLRGAIRARRR